MMDLSFLWLVSLVITHVCAYAMGKEDGKSESGLSDEAWVELQKYEIDKRYAHLRWIAEKDNRHDA